MTNLTPPLSVDKELPIVERRFTPGPWQTKNDYVPDCLTVIANVDGEIIDGVTHNTYDFIATCEDEYGEFSLDARGNARLIAAAPELYEALATIASLRPAGDINAAKNTRELVRQIEVIALAALARVGQ